MLHTVIKKNSYQDSVNLMLLSKKLSNLEGINNVSVMMGTEANKDIFLNSGLYTDELKDAKSNDLCCVIDTDDEALINVVLEEMKLFFESSNNNSSNKNRVSLVHSFSSIPNKQNGTNIALISVPGEYAYKESMKALKNNMNVFLFSDNVNLEEEKALKEYANKNDLIVMGPDCGTSILQSVPFAFANIVNEGNIGIVGASGTGIQEISTLISNYGLGITHAIGLGGRDLKEEIGGISALSAIEMLEKDEKTEVIVFVSKPPAPSVMNKILDKFKSLSKPVVANFLGMKNMKSDDIFLCKTLAETAKKATEIAKVIRHIKEYKENPKLVGLYCGGTLAQESAILFEDYFNLEFDSHHDKGIMFDNHIHKIIDLGDDFYTKGRPHPMIDPSIRIEVIEKMIKENDYDIILLDNVIGYGSNEQMAELTAKIAEKYSNKIFITSITGTDKDFQDYNKEKEILEKSNVIVADTNVDAVNISLEALKLLNKKKQSNKANTNNTLLSEPLKVVNIGLKKFLDPFIKNSIPVVQFDFRPVAGGNKELEQMLEDLS